MVRSDLGAFLVDKKQETSLPGGTGATLFDNARNDRSNAVHIVGASCDCN